MNFGEEYNNKGYIILKDIYSSEEVDKIKSIVNDLDIEKFEHSKDASGYPFRITNILPKNKELKKNNRKT
tara:strand:+ start:36 stop:245 length:210 start_codon:yes stop_codon:yes gene_type:complete